MNSQQPLCPLHCLAQFYFCSDCSDSLCEDCVLSSHYQHTVTYKEIPPENRNLINLNNKHIKWLLNKEQQIQVLEQIIQFQIDEKITLNHNLHNCSTNIGISQYKNQIINSDHENIIYNYAEQLFINDDQEFNDQNQLYLDAKSYNFTERTWDQLCSKLTKTQKLKVLSIQFCNSSLNSNLLQQLIESIIQKNELKQLELDMKNTQVTDEAVISLKALFLLPKLIIFEARVQNCSITVDVLNEFWLQYGQYIKETYQYFYIFHHLCTQLFYQIHLVTIKILNKKLA